MNTVPVHTTNMMPIDLSYCGEPVLACPFCGHHFVAISGIEVTSPGQEMGKVTIDSWGIDIDPDQPADGRGSKVTIRYACECGHYWKQRLHFYKGATHVSLMAIPKLDSRNDENAIWRN